MVETKKKKKAACDAAKAAGGTSMSGSEASGATRHSADTGKRRGPAGPSGQSPRQSPVLSGLLNDSVNLFVSAKKRIKSRSANDASEDDDGEELEEPTKGQFNM
jgi:hypothetical protein